MTDHKGQPVSPYLMKPLRSFQEALAERGAATSAPKDVPSKARPQSEAEEPVEEPLWRVA